MLFRSAGVYAPRTVGWPPSSLSSYSTLKPDTVSDADTQEMTKLLEVISVTDSEVSTIGGSWVVSPSDVATGWMEESWIQIHIPISFSRAHISEPKSRTKRSS